MVIKGAAPQCFSYPAFSIQEAFSSRDSASAALRNARFTIACANSFEIARSGRQSCPMRRLQPSKKRENHNEPTRFEYPGTEELTRPDERPAVVKCLPLQCMCLTIMMLPNIMHTCPYNAQTISKPNCSCAFLSDHLILFVMFVLHMCPLFGPKASNKSIPPYFSLVLQSRLHQSRFTAYPFVLRCVPVM